MRGMTVGQLIAELENYDDETPVLLGFQPSWPLRFEVAGVTQPGVAAVDPDEGNPDCAVGRCTQGCPVEEEVLREQELGNGNVGRCDCACHSEQGPVYILQGEHPRDGSPYGVADWWEQV